MKKTISTLLTLAILMNLFIIAPTANAAVNTITFNSESGICPLRLFPLRLLQTQSSVA